MPSAAPRVRRRLVGVLLILLTSFVLLEVTLQIAALSVWAFARPTTDAGKGAGRTVLCIGDSFTWGLGASRRDQSYPGQLQRLLRERTGQEWSVANCALPGRNSREALVLLPEQIREFKPSWLCVLIGINDGWSQPAPVTVTMQSGGEAASGFRLELRTLRLLKLVLGSGSGRAANVAIDAAATQPAAAPAPTPASESPVARTAASVPQELLGWWLLASLPVRIGNECVFEINGAAVPFTVDGDRFELRLPDQKVAGTWRVNGAVATLVLMGKEIPMHRIPEPVAVPPAVPVIDSTALFSSAWDKMGCGDAAGAEKLFRQLVDHDHSPWSRSSLVAALCALGRDEDARRETESLRADWERTKDYTIAEGYMQALETMHRLPEALALAEVIIRDRPGSSAAWRFKAAWHKERHEDVPATVAYEKTIALLPDKSGGWRADLLRALTEVAASHDPKRAIAALVEAYLCDHDRPHTIQLLSWIADKVRDVQYEPILAALVADAGDRKVLHDILASQGRPDPQHLVTLFDHLRQMAELCRTQGIDLVVLGYPFPGGEIETVQRKAAELAGAPFVAVWPRFDKELKTRKREELFVGDGHCNDVGYGMMAELAVDAMLRRLRP